MERMKCPVCSWTYLVLEQDYKRLDMNESSRDVVPGHTMPPTRAVCTGSGQMPITEGQAVVRGASHMSAAALESGAAEEVVPSYKIRPKDPPVMATLTPAQAKVLREIRPRLRPTVLLLDGWLNQLSGSCPHVDKPKPTSCPMCRVYVTISAAHVEIQHLPDEVDSFLTRGPGPQEV